MKNRLFNDFDLTNEEIEKILKEFNHEIKIAINRLNGNMNEDYEQFVKIQIFKALSKNRKK